MPPSAAPADPPPTPASTASSASAPPSVPRRALAALRGEAFDRAGQAAAVPSSFDQDAGSYDRLVGANPGYHDHLRRSAARLGLPGRGAGLRLLDVGCGTGLSTRALVEAYPEAEIVAADASAEMLAQARAKSWPVTVRFVHSRAEELATHGVEGPFDGILAAYLLRNLPDVGAGVADLRDLLAPGAPLAVHEYSVADSAYSRAVWTAVCWAVVIPLGRRVTGDASLYRYLWRSVLAFDGLAALTTRLRDAGFDGVRVEPMDGWQRGIVHTVLGLAPTGPRQEPADRRRRTS